MAIFVCLVWHPAWHPRGTFEYTPAPDQSENSKAQARRSESAFSLRIEREKGEKKRKKRKKKEGCIGSRLMVL